MDFSCVIPVVCVTVLNVFLGMLWYSPLVLGKMWVKAYKFDVKKLKPTLGHYVGSILVSLVTVIVFAFLIQKFQAATWKCGMVLGLCLWVGFIVTTQFSGVIWAKKPLRVYFIDIAYHLISLVMMGILLAAWL